MTKSIAIKPFCLEVLRLFAAKDTYDVLTTAVRTVTNDPTIVLSLRDRKILTEMALAAQNGYDHEDATYLFTPVDLTYKPTEEEHVKFCLHAKWADFRSACVAELNAMPEGELSLNDILVMLYKAFMTGAIAENGLAMQLTSVRQFGNERLANVMEQHNLEIFGEFLADCQEERRLHALRELLGALFPEDSVDLVHEAATNKLH